MLKTGTSICLPSTLSCSSGGNTCGSGLYNWPKQPQFNPQITSIPITATSRMPHLPPAGPPPLSIAARNKPQPAHFERARELLREQRWLHAAQSYFHDIEPAAELGIPVFSVNRKKEAPSGTARPIAQADTLTRLVEWLDGADAAEFL